MPSIYDIFFLEYPYKSYYPLVYFSSETYEVCVPKFHEVLYYNLNLWCMFRIQAHNWVGAILTRFALTFLVSPCIHSRLPVSSVKRRRSSQCPLLLNAVINVVNKRLAWSVVKINAPCDVFLTNYFWKTYLAFNTTSIWTLSLNSLKHGCVIHPSLQIFGVLNTPAHYRWFTLATLFCLSSLKLARSAQPSRGLREPKKHKTKRFS